LPTTERTAEPSLQVIRPTRDDIRYRKRFLDETAERSNRRIGERLTDLLTAIHGSDPGSSFLRKPPKR
jgi:hypothetical protein